MASIVLLLAAGLQLTMSSSATLPVVARQAPPVAPSVEPVQVALSAYSAIMAHPIFAPDRAPPAAEADDSGNLSGVEVLGTAIAGKTSTALVRDSDGDFTRMKLGEELDGWKLVSIEPKELVFDRAGERKSVVISATAPNRPGITTKMGKAGAAGSTTSSSSDSDDDDDDSDD